MLFPRLFGWLVSLLITLSSLPGAIATGPAGAFERIGPLYQTYRIAVATWGADQKKILSGLTGTHPDGGANFREMINYVDSIPETDERSTVDFWTDEGININDPDPRKAAVHMYFNDITDLFKFPMIFPGAGQLMPEVLEKIRKVLEDAHEEMKTKGKLDDIKHFRDQLDVCHTEILAFRQSETEGGDNGKKAASKEIKKKWPSAVVKVDTLSWPHDPYFVIYKLNTQATVDLSPAGTFTVKAVEDWVRDYGAVETDPAVSNTAKNHYKVIFEHRSTMSGERHRLENGC